MSDQLNECIELLRQLDSPRRMFVLKFLRYLSTEQELEELSEEFSVKEARSNLIALVPTRTKGE